MNIHKTALIDPGAKIDSGVTIGPYCVIGANVQIGKNCHLASHVCIEGHTEIGENNFIGSHAVIGVAPQDKHYLASLPHAPTRVIIGNDNVFREHVTIHRASLKENHVTQIGNKNFLMCYSHVAHDCRVGNGCTFANLVQLAGHVVIEDEVILSGLSSVAQFCKIGRNSFIGGNSGIDRSVPPFSVGSGDRFLLRGINIKGLRRKKIPNHEIIQLVKILDDVKSKKMGLKTYLNHQFSLVNHTPSAIVEEWSNWIKSEKNISQLNFTMGRGGEEISD